MLIAIFLIVKKTCLVNGSHFILKAVEHLVIARMKHFRFAARNLCGCCSPNTVPQLCEMQALRSACTAARWVPMNQGNRESNHYAGHERKHCTKQSARTSD